MSAFNLTPADMQMLSRFGISGKLLEQSLIMRVSNDEARELLSVNGRAGDMAGLFFPYFSPITGSRVTGRLRRDNPGSCSC